jgi:amino acid adenylation domain-containing protein
VITTLRLIRQHADLNPGSIAVSYLNEQLTYDELDKRSSELAAILLQEGVVRGARVGVCIDRGLDLAVALLAIIKSGAGYVPLDPSYPIQRLKIMAESSSLTLTLTSNVYTSLLSPVSRVLEVKDSSKLAISTSSPSPSPSSANSWDIAGNDDLAYIIYTSGSTGVPKGVSMPRGPLDNLVQWQLNHPRFSQPAKVLQFTPVSFDVHFQEFFVTWAGGGELVMISDHQRRDPLSLLRTIIDNNIERLFLPFVALQQLIEQAVNYGPFPTSLKDVVTAGEQLVVSDYVRTFFSRLPECRLHNQYGPSESHVVTALTLKGDPKEWHRIPSIGVPIDNAIIYILDNNLNEVVKGESGELCIGGQVLAQGYWGREDLTNEKFITVDIAGKPERVYRTGDLAQLNANGEFSYLGRLDNQVKIRGHRVEIGEIEAVIANHQAIKEVAVIAVGEGSAERKLLSYLVLDAYSTDMNTNDIHVQIKQWQDVWDGTYSQQNVSEDSSISKVGEAINSRFDTRGWNSSYTGAPLPTKEMKAWVDGTVEKILPFQPKRVLEIGAGTGLILFALAPYCQYYHATDYSEVSAKLLQQLIDDATDLNVELRASALPADQIKCLQGEAFDTVVINSVTQHLVTLEYVVDMIEQACALVEPVGGRVYIGDVTCLNTREAFFTSLECYRAQPNTNLSELKVKVEKALAEERELVFSPEFFYALKERISGISAVDVQLKPGSYSNELSQFRFDVILYLDKKTVALGESQVSWIPWKDIPSTDFFYTRLQEMHGGSIGFKGLPNKRTLKACQQMLLLRNSGLNDMSNLSAQLEDKLSEHTGFSPDQFRRLAQELDLGVQILFSDDAGSIDVIFHQSKDRFYEPLLDNSRPISDYATCPANLVLMPSVVAKLKKMLVLELPEYMWPSQYILLSRLPQTPSGKLDRRALPEPSTKRPILENEFVAACGDLETKLAIIWAKLLELDDVGVNDNFFDLGGNSILSLKLGLLIRRELDVEVTVVALFQYPTVRTMANYLSPSDRNKDEQKERALQRAKNAKKAFAKVKSNRSRRV